MDRHAMPVEQRGMACLVRQVEGYKAMKIVWNIIGIVLLLAGGVWFLQGVGLLPGSFMSGQIQWAVYGGLAALMGAGLLLYANRRRAR